MTVIGIDIGGTFTDVVALDTDSGVLRAAKSLTVPGNETQGVLEGLDELGIEGRAIERLVHGTTIGTNAILERRGAKTALLVTEGFRDLLEIGRTRRMAPDTMFSLTFRRPPPLLPRPLRFDVPERMLASGAVLLQLDEARIDAILRDLQGAGIQAVAICYLHSYANPEHENRSRAIVARALPQAAVSLSHEVVPEYREYERLTTTVLNAFISPLMERYLGDLEERLGGRGSSGQLYVMASNGGVMSAERAKRFPVQTVLSGPAGGVSAAILLGETVGAKNLITCDMGGTSTDVAIVTGLEPRISVDNVIDGIPLKVPQVDITTIGAGGGSIAEVDDHGQLRVGPRSAGSTPGPICYGRGGSEITVTDANLLLQRLALRRPLGGKIHPNVDLVRTVLADLAQRLGVEDAFKVAAGIVRVAVAKMVGSIREISIARGHDPRDYALVAFGGAGPMHAIAVAEELHMRKVIVPAFAGNFSALGLLASDIRHDLAETLLEVNRPEAMTLVAAAVARLKEQARARLATEGFSEEAMVFAPSADMRYRGQAFEIAIPLVAAPCTGGRLDAGALTQAFHSRYESLYGRADEEQETEIVNIRLAARVRTPKPRIRNPVAPGDALIERRTVYFDGALEDVAVYDRDLIVRERPLRGPAIIEELSATTVVAPGWSFQRDAFDNLILERLA